jgi:hypothetical protein
VGSNLKQEKIFMTKLTEIANNLTMLCLFVLIMTACGREPVVSFSQDVKPIIDQYCIECHQLGGKGEVVSGLNVSTHDKLMDGTRSGPIIIEGDAEGSSLLAIMDGSADPSTSIPHGGQYAVYPQDIQTIRVWIGQGAQNN